MAKRAMWPYCLYSKNCSWHSGRGRPAGHPLGKSMSRLPSKNLGFGPGNADSAQDVRTCRHRSKQVRATLPQSSVHGRTPQQKALNNCRL